MKTRIFLTLGSLLWVVAPLAAQDTPPPPPTAPAAAAQPDAPYDPFEGLKKQADIAEAEYESAVDKAKATIQKQVPTKKCQWARIDPDITAATDALKAWYDKESEYLKQWRSLNAEKSQRSLKQIENLKADQAEAKHLQESYEEELDALEQRFNNNQTGPQNPQTRKEADELKDRIKQKQEDIAAQVQKYDGFQKTIVELDAVYDLDLSKTNEYVLSVDAKNVDEKAYWNEQRTVAETVCGKERPDPTNPPLPKGGRGQL